MPGRAPAAKPAASCFSTPRPPPAATSRSSGSAPAQSTTTNATNSASATAGKSSVQTRFKGAVFQLLGRGTDTARLPSAFSLDNAADRTIFDRATSTNFPFPFRPKEDPPHGHPRARRGRPSSHSSDSDAGRDERRVRTAAEDAEAAGGGLAPPGVRRPLREAARALAPALSHDGERLRGRHARH